MIVLNLFMHFSPVVAAEAPPTMVYVPGGSFMMGSPTSEMGRDTREVQHEVEVSGFLMMTTEVTQELYQEVMGDNPSARERQGGQGLDIGPCSTMDGVNLVDDTFPVMCVSWFDAAQFANALSLRDGLRPAYQVSGETVHWKRAANGYRLPTEAEWEWAARGGEAGLFGSVNTYKDVCYVGNISDWNARAHSGHFIPASARCADGFVGLAPVGQYEPNGYGLYDMVGNVSEWTWDWSGPYTSKQSTDPTGPEEGDFKATRGGSWQFGAPFARNAARGAVIPGGRTSGLGLRLVRSAPRNVRPGPVEPDVERQPRTGVVLFGDTPERANHYCASGLLLQGMVVIRDEECQAEGPLTEACWERVHARGLYTLIQLDIERQDNDNVQIESTWLDAFTGVSLYQEERNVRDYRSTVKQACQNLWPAE